MQPGKMINEVEMLRKSAVKCGHARYPEEYSRIINEERVICLLFILLLSEG